MEAEFRYIGQMANIAPSAEAQIVYAPNLISTFEQSVERSQVAAIKPQRREFQHGVARREESGLARLLDKRG